MSASFLFHGPASAKTIERQQCPTREENEAFPEVNTTYTSNRAVMAGSKMSTQEF